MAVLVMLFVFCVCLNEIIIFSDEFCGNIKLGVVYDGFFLGNMAFVVKLSGSVTIHAFVRREIFDVF